MNRRLKKCLVRIDDLEAQVLVNETIREELR